MRIFIGCVLLGISTLSAVRGAEPLASVGRLELAGVEGRFDHFAFDAATNRLFVAALGNDTIEVVDVRGARRVTSVRGVDEPQGLAWVPPGRLIIANGGNGDVQLREGDDLRVGKTVATAGDADNVRYDASARRAYVGVASGALLAIDPATGAKLGEVRLPGHPESFQLERNGARIFVNIPHARQIAVVDRRGMTIAATWRVTAAQANYPMALDEDDRRLFVICRSPARVLVYDTTSGKMTASFAAVGDADDAFFDAGRKRLYVIGGQGFVDVFQRQDADHYASIAHVPTAPGARTGLFVPDSQRLFVAVPHRGQQGAAILMFEPRD
jgi:DNA-binding beta-propeller fold protein YncE